MKGALLAVVAALALASCDQVINEPVERPAFDQANAPLMKVDDLLLEFVDNEVAGNDKWRGQSLRLVGYITSIDAATPPTVSIQGVSDIPVQTDISDKSEILALKEGETVELNCVGADRRYELTTAHDCAVAYHGKRRDEDPYWPSPYALKDPL